MGYKVWFGEIFPPEIIVCTKFFNEYVVNLCRSCKADYFCQQDCNSAAEAYYKACSVTQGKKPLRLFFQDDWGVQPGVGIVPTSNKLNPIPTLGPGGGQNLAPSPCEARSPNIHDCLEVGRRANDGETFSSAECQRCCDDVADDCAPYRILCKQNCDWHGALSGMHMFNETFSDLKDEIEKREKLERDQELEEILRVRDIQEVRAAP